MKKLFILLILLLLLDLPTQFNFKSAQAYHGEKIDVLVFLNIEIDSNRINKIKSKYYDSFTTQSTWTEIDQALTLMRKSIYNYLKQKTQPFFKKVSNQIHSLGGEIKDYFYSIGAIHASIPLDAIPYLNRNPLVRKIREPLIFRINLNIAAKAIYANVWWDQGYNGSNDISQYLPNDTIKGIEIAILDTGIDMDNPYLADRIIAAKDFSGEGTPDDQNGHGTFVAGIIASNDTKYHGIAVGVNLINAKCLNKKGEGSEDQIYAALEWVLTEIDDSPEIINTSFGTNQLDPNGESEFTKNIDKYIDLYDVAWVTAAGNKDDETGLQLNVPGDFYNGLTIGAINDKNTVSREDDSWASFSCIGPTSDGRIKPDIVAPGESIISTTNLGYFGVESGTSFSTPMVAGSLALVAPLLIMKFREKWYLAAKALLINSADDWGATGPDPYTGWGYINLLNAWNSVNYVLLANVLVGDTVPISIFAENNSLLKATFTWNRHFNPATNDFYKLTSFNITLTNDRNERINYTIHESKNVIQISFTPQEIGYYYIYIKINSIDPSLNRELISIASNAPIYLGLVSSNLTIRLDAPQEIYDSDVIDLKVTLGNKGDNTINQIKLNVTVNDDLALLNQSLPIHVGSIDPGEEKTISIYLRPMKIGLQLIRVVAYYEHEGKLVMSLNHIRVLVIDDDTSKPVISQITISGSPIVFRSIRIVVEAFDESGISKVIVYYKLEDQNIFENNYDGVIQLHREENGKFVGDIMIPVNWIGKTIYFRVKVIDNDNDRANDAEFSWSDTIHIEIPLEINVVILLIPVILAVLILIAIKKRR